MSRSAAAASESGRSKSIFASSTGADNTAVTRMLAELGLSAKTGWYLSFFLYTLEGLGILIAGALMPDVVPGAIMGLAGLAVAFGFFSLFGAIHFGDQKSVWTTHLRLAPGMMLLTAGIVILGPTRGQAFVMLPMLTVLTPCFLYGPRFAIPYSSWTIIVVLYGLIGAESVAHTARVVIDVGCVIMIITSFVIAERRMRVLTRTNTRLAYSDPLTGIANTRKLRERIASSLSELADGGRGFALFAMDLDNFKLVNDTFDHSTGDAVLRAVAEEIESELDERNGDFVARRGGDEFSVLVPLGDHRDLDELTRRIAKAIGRARMNVCPAITPSGSVAYVKAEPGDTLASVLQRADDNLHEVKTTFHAKHLGRDAALAAIAEQLAPHEQNDVLTDLPAAVPESPSGFWTAVRKRFTGHGALVAYAGTVFLPIGLVCGAMAVTGQLRPLSPLTGGLINLGFVALAAICFAGSGGRHNQKLLHFAFASAMTLVCVEAAIAGPAGIALVDVLVVLGLNTFYYFTPRGALPYLLTALIAYPALSLSGDYANAGVRIAVVTMVLVLAATVIIKIRAISVNFIQMNRELSEVDALTGVANLRSLRSRAERVLEAAAGSPAKPSIVSVDLDRFKLVNDTYNHTVGDQVIVAVARALDESLREDDMVARRGGDEFFVLCSGEAHEIQALSARLSQAVIHARMRICPDLMPSASITFIQHADGEDADAFLARADVALHDEKAAKRARGYDRVSA